MKYRSTRYSSNTHQIFKCIKRGVEHCIAMYLNSYMFVIRLNHVNGKINIIKYDQNVHKDKISKTEM